MFLGCLRFSFFMLHHLTQLLQQQPPSVFLLVTRKVDKKKERNWELSEPISLREFFQWSRFLFMLYGRDFITKFGSQDFKLVQCTILSTEWWLELSKKNRIDVVQINGHGCHRTGKRWEVNFDLWKFYIFEKSQEKV